MLLLSAYTKAQTPLGSEFTYQGELQVSSAPANELYDFEFFIYDALTLGNQTGTMLVEDVEVTNGVFNVTLDFGTNAFAGDKVWLEITVREGASTSAFQPLSPRQPINSTPYAIHAQFVSSDSISGIEILNGSISNVDLAVDSVTVDNIVQNAVGTSEIIDGSIGSVDVISSEIQLRIASSCPAGSGISQIAADGSVTCVSIAPNSTTTNVVKIIDSTPSSGSLSDMVFGLDGFPRITYYDETNDALKLAICEDENCSSATTKMLQTSLGGPAFSAMAIGDDGSLAIVYYYTSMSQLYYMKCRDSSCLVVEGNKPLLVALTLSSRPNIDIKNGSVYVNFYDQSSLTLKAVYCHLDLLCDTIDIFSIISNEGEYPTMVISPINNVAYVFWYSGSKLAVAECKPELGGFTTIICNTPALVGSDILISGLAPAPQVYPHAIIDSRGIPVVFYSIKGADSNEQGQAIQAYKLGMLRCELNPMRSSVCEFGTTITGQSDQILAGDWCDNTRCEPPYLDAALDPSGNIYVINHRGQLKKCIDSLCNSMSVVMETTGVTQGVSTPANGLENGISLLMNSNSKPIIVGQLENTIGSSGLMVRTCRNRFCSRR